MQPITNDQSEKPAGRLLSLNEIAFTLNVSPRSIWRLVAAGQLAAPTKVGRCVRWFPEDLAQYLDKLRHQRENSRQVVASRGANHEDVGVSDANAPGNNFSSNQAPLRRQRRSS